MSDQNPSVRERLRGKPLIGFDTRSPRQPAAMVGSVTVKAAPPPSVKAAASSATSSEP